MQSQKKRSAARANQRLDFLEGAHYDPVLQASKYKEIISFYLGDDPKLGREVLEREPIFAVCLSTGTVGRQRFFLM